LTMRTLKLKSSAKMRQMMQRTTLKWKAIHDR
jgi:hypothetical protein